MLTAGRYELAEAKLANAEAQIEDLKVQLDDALGAEDMLEQLTERNLQMGEVR
jgi:dynactin 1